MKILQIFLKTYLLDKKNADSSEPALYYFIEYSLSLSPASN